MSGKTCVFVRDDGTRCGMVANIDPRTGLCIWHDKNRKEEAAKMRSKGGKQAGARAKARKPVVRTVNAEEAPPPPKTLEDAMEWASWAVWAVTTGKIDARTGHEVAYLLRAFMDGKKHLDRTDEKVKELEAKLAKLRKVAEEGTS